MKKSGKISKKGKAKTTTSNMSDWYDCCWDPSHDFCCSDSTCCC